MNQIEDRFMIAVNRTVVLVHGKIDNIENIMYYVYILKSLKDRKLYIGRTSNLQRRMAEHKLGKVKSTRPRRPIQLIFYEAFLDKASSIKREGYFKTTKGKKALKLMLGNTLK